jgi:hypothetical protein
VSDDTVPGNLDSLALHRIADALEGLLELKRKDLAGEIQKKGYHGTKKDAAVWIRCSQEAVRLLGTKAFVGWDDVKELPAFRDPGTREDRSDGANMTREHQWKWFLKQHAIPRTPEYGAHLVAVGEEDKNGPSAVTLKGQEHCAKRAFDHVPDTDTRVDVGGRFDENCSRCVARKRVQDEEHAREAARRKIEREAALLKLNTEIDALKKESADPTTAPRRKLEVFRLLKDLGWQQLVAERR